MPIKLEYLRDLNILIATVEGSTTIEMFKQTINELISSIEYPPDVSTIWDLRKLDFDSIDSNFVKRVIAIRKDIDNKRGNVKIAYVVNSDLSFGITRMYEIFSEIEGLAQSIQIFRNLDDAKKWLLKDK
ncbi:MAG: hypothetical protein HOG03_07365 [Desulfobacula sp.]|jgi:hypothetical protein|uniref:hypothetical protein n=1 Tax=Desulfobacula sp. TaxID=2593537 RepID=UPI001D411B20|nr:hypothetical protein [Desulfobacula sp.]MBT3484777.1 hypothetical protein [Desulfobacula sp.]MBT3804406.1 hypothetical protein [Desulfobacula sp.]MBT4025197.1 hypothetical protein [Desulfobacula sp.]MBT4198600.1 hypothetical protein [Desulfobacula sp.]